MMQSFITFQHNTTSVLAKTATIADAANRDKVCQTKYREHILGFTNHMDAFDDQVQEMAAKTGYQERLNEILSDLSSANSKTSAVEKDPKAATFEAAAKKKCKMIAAERKVDGVFFIAPDIGAKIVLIFLGKTNPGHQAAVHAEIAHRQIKHKEPLDNMIWYPTLELLKIHELGIFRGGRRVRRSGGGDEGKAMTSHDVKDIVPQTAELKALLDEQEKWAAEKHKC